MGSHCANRGCPFRLKFGRPAEYRAGFDRCSDCGQLLVGGERPPLISLEEAPPSRCDLGRPSGPTLRLRDVPDGFIAPLLLLGLSLLCVGFAAEELRYLPEAADLIPLLTAAALFAVAVRTWRRRARAPARTVQPHALGFRFAVGEQTWDVAWSEVKTVELRREGLVGTSGLLSIHVLEFELAASRVWIASLGPSGLNPAQDPFLAWATGILDPFHAIAEVSVGCSSS